MTFLILILLIALFVWGIIKYNVIDGNNWGRNVGLSKEAQAALDYIFYDKMLVYEIANILRKEGDIDDLFNKILADIKFNSDGYTWSQLSKLDKKTIHEYPFQKDAKRIADKIVKTDSFKVFSRRNYLSQQDQEMMNRLFYFFVTSHDFKENAIKIMSGEISDSPYPPIHIGQLMIT